TPGVIAIDGRGRARRFADLPGVRPNGIAFDNVGRFGRRLLVTAAARGRTTVFSIDCHRQVKMLSSNAPPLEGGVVVAPKSFGRFAGHLIAPDELTGRIWAIGPDGSARLVARSPLPSGQDIGVESAAFVPAGFGPGWGAYVADRGTPRNPHPGTNSILRLSAADFVGAGVGPGDLVIANEGGAQTIVVHCGRTCTVRHIADGPRTSHIEGHVVFVEGLGWIFPADLSRDPRRP
ncbi:MAG TPA: hypothetical protein VKK30_00670, partial [Actinomycetota bacterium]|nr:hypothetical protein [Actinomycetota bacterium]